MLITDCICPV